MFHGASMPGCCVEQVEQAFFQQTSCMASLHAMHCHVFIPAAGFTNQCKHFSCASLLLGLDASKRVVCQGVIFYFCWFHVQGGTLEVFGPELYLSQQHSLEPDAYTTGCLAFLAGMILDDYHIF